MEGDSEAIGAWKYDSDDSSEEYLITNGAMVPLIDNEYTTLQTFSQTRPFPTCTPPRDKAGTLSTSDACMSFQWVHVSNQMTKYEKPDLENVKIFERDRRHAVPYSLCHLTIHQAIHISLPDQLVPFIKRS
jgi:hypothetical protein